MNLYLDTETIPAQRPDMIAWLSARALAKGTDPGATDKTYRDTSLSPVLGELAVVSLAIDDSEPITFVRDMGDPMGERALVSRVCQELRDIDTGTQFARNLRHLVAHNAAFDRTVLRTRAMVHGERLPPQVHALALKPWDSPWYCTMDALKGAGPSTSLDAACIAFNVGLPKGDIDGSKVWDAVLQGRIDEVAAYCADDVRRVRAVYRAIMAVTERGTR